MITLTGTFQYDDGTPIDGEVILDLIASGQFMLIDTAQEAGTETTISERYVITINAGSISGIKGNKGFTSTNTILGNHEISPPNTQYRCVLLDAIGQEIQGALDITINTDPYDLSAAVPSSPPTNIITSSLLVSNPPSGNMVIKNFYVNTSGKVVIEYDDTPV